MKSSLELTALKDQALTLMSKAGYPIAEEVIAEEDLELDIMGYTTKRDGKTLIVVSTRALKSQMALSLLIHELSHVYRIASGHPSHDNQLLSTITGWAVRGVVVHEYQEEIVRNALNILEDIYADDISFALFAKLDNKTDLSQFFLGWVREASEDKDPVKKAWKNADALVNAAFAKANMHRHNIIDTSGEVQKHIDALLKKIDNRVAEKFTFFKDFMIALPTDVSKKEFESMLIRYLSEFLKLTKIH